MKRRIFSTTACLLFSMAASAQVDPDISMNLTLDTLNRLANRVGDLSDAGLYQPEVPEPLSSLFRRCEFFGHFDCLLPGGGAAGSRPSRKKGIPLVRCIQRDGSITLLPLPDAAPVAWQWWITDGAFRVEGNRLRFEASVRSRIGSRWSKQTGSADADIRLSADKEHAMVSVGHFEVPLEASFNGSLQQVTTVDVGKLRSFSVAINPQHMSIPRPDGTLKELTMKVSSLKRIHYTADAIELEFDVGF